MTRRPTAAPSPLAPSCSIWAAAEASPRRFLPGTGACAWWRQTSGATPRMRLPPPPAWGLARDVLPVHADACDLPFAEEVFDAVTCIDAYNYFGRDESYLGQRLLPFVRHGGLVYLAISGLACDVADFGGALPAELACSWTVEQLEYLWPRERWQRLFAAQRDVRVERIRDLSCNDEAWRDWVACDNPYAAGDRRAIEAGALAWLTTTEVVLRRL